VRISLLATLPCLFLCLAFDAVAQPGRLGGTVAYSAGAQAVVARNVRVIASGAYGGAETRTDNNGNFVLVLAAGTYQVMAFGAAGYTQYQQVMGYVRAYSDSIITPNPIFLVPARYRSSDSMNQSVLIHTDAWNGDAKLAPESVVTLKIAAEKSGTGWLSGTVKIGNKNKGCDAKSVAAGNFEVKLKGLYGVGGTQLRTKSDGKFVTEPLPAGPYKITVKYDEFWPSEALVTVEAGQTVSVSICMAPK